jgi:hypothetical protein
MTMRVNPSRDYPISYLLFTLALLALSGCGFSLGGPTIQGSGVLKTEKRDLKGFDQIDVSAAIQLNFATGPQTTVEVSSDDNLLPLVVTEVKDGTLIIAMKGSTSTRIGTTVKVSAPKLKALTASGASKATLSGVAEKALRLDVSGASEVTASGTADRLEIECAGASRVNAMKLTAQTVVVKASGASTAEVQTVQELDADASGASTIRYEGSPAKKKENTSGASTIVKK